MNAEPNRPSTADLDVNLRGALYTTTLALQYLRLPDKGDKIATQAHGKSLIFVSSLAGYIDDTHNTVYTASKFGMRGLWRGIRARAAEIGVRCNLIASWAIKTPMTAPLLEVMGQMGIKEGAGITFAGEDTVVQATMRCISDTSVSGEFPVRDDVDQDKKLNRLSRAFPVVPEGFLDIGDDIDGGYAGVVLQQLMKTRKEAGDFLYG